MAPLCRPVAQSQRVGCSLFLQAQGAIMIMTMVAAMAEWNFEGEVQMRGAPRRRGAGVVASTEVGDGPGRAMAMGQEQQQAWTPPRRRRWTWKTWTATELNQGVG